MNANETFEDTEGDLQRDEDVLAAVSEAVEEADVEDVNEMTTDTGVRVSIGPLPTQIIASFLSKLSIPQPPIIDIKDGTRTRREENIDDPGYLRALGLRHAKAAAGVENIMLIKCITVLALPEGMLSYEEDEDWFEEYDSIFQEDPHDMSRTTRYLEWLKWRVFTTNNDDDVLTEKARKHKLVDQEEVKKMAESF